MTPLCALRSCQECSPESNEFAQAQFYGLLDDYVTSAAGADALNDVVLASDGTIVTSQMGFSHTASYNQVPFLHV